MPTPDSDLVTALDTALSLASGTNLFRGPVREVSADCPPTAVFCLTTGGPPPSPYIGIGEDFRRSTVQVRIRSDLADTFETGQELARSVLTALQRAVVSGYVWCYVRESEPNYLGQDDNENHEWSVNVELAWKG